MSFEFSIPGMWNDSRDNFYIFFYLQKQQNTKSYVENGDVGQCLSLQPMEIGSKDFAVESGYNNVKVYHRCNKNNWQFVWLIWNSQSQSLVYCYRNKSLLMLMSISAGDNMDTAINVARQCNMVGNNEKITILEANRLDDSKQIELTVCFCTVVKYIFQR